MFENVPTKSFLEEFVDYATELITGNSILGGRVVLHKDATTGEPYELLILDNPDISRAVNVWRWNSGGLGHSSHGYNGPYDDVAITMDGKINATAIAVGVLNAAIIKAGVLSDAAGLNTWDMVSGALNMTTGSINIGNGNFVVNNSGAMSCKGASVEGTMESYSTSRTNAVKISEGQITGGQGGAQIKCTGTFNYGTTNQQIELWGIELFLSISNLYITTSRDGTTAYQGITDEIDVENPNTGMIYTLKFVNGILVAPT